MSKQVDLDDYKLVLRKLKLMTMDGSLGTDEIRYVYAWDKKMSDKANIQNIRKEDAALRYFAQIKLIDANRIENTFRTEGRNVWGKSWDETDPAHRLYDWIVSIYSVDNDRFETELKKFGLEDSGIELIELTAVSDVSSIKSKLGKFTAHKDGSVRYLNGRVQLKPEQRRLVYALLIQKGATLPRTDIIDALWDYEGNNSGYLDNPVRTDRVINKRISNIVSEANSVLHGYDNKTHIENTGETSYKFVA